MTVIFAIVFVMLVFVYFGNVFATPKQRLGEEAAYIAASMKIYHAAASAACAGSCTGTIDPTPKLPSYRQGHGIFANGELRSAGIGGYVATYYVSPLLASATPERAREVNSWVVGAVLDTLDSGIDAYAGTYDAASGQVKAAQSPVWRDAGALTPVTISFAPVTLSAANIPNEAPILVTAQ